MNNSGKISASVTPTVELSGSINGIVRTFIENNYKNLINLPSINGVTLIDDVSIEQLGISSVVTKDYVKEFPNLGNSKNIYIAQKENKVYRWDEANLKYYIIGSDYNDIKVINGGKASDA